MRPRRLRAPAERRLGWLLAVLAALVWPAASWHDATTLHEVCPEHGDLLDVAAPAEDPAPDEGPRWSRTVGGGEHEQCPFVALAQPTSPGEVPRLADVTAHDTVVALPAPCETRRLSIPLLLLAPKQSPPV